MTLDVYSQTSNSNGTVTSITTGATTPAASDRVVVALAFETDIFSTTLTNITGCTVSAGAESGTLTYHGHYKDSTSGSEMYVAWLSYEMTTAFAAAADIANSVGISTAGISYVGEDFTYLTGMGAFLVQGDSDISTIGGDGEEHASIPTTTDTLSTGANTVADGGLMLAFTSAYGACADNSIAGLTLVYTGSPSSANQASGDTEELNDGLWWATKTAYVYGTGLSETLTMVVNVTDTANDNIKSGFLGYMLLNTAVADPTNISPDAYAAYDRRYARAKALPFYLDTGLLRRL